MHSAIRRCFWTDNFLISQSIKTQRIVCITYVLAYCIYTNILYANIVYSNLGYMGEKKVIAMNMILKCE